MFEHLLWTKHYILNSGEELRLGIFCPLYVTAFCVPRPLGSQKVAHQIQLTPYSDLENPLCFVALALSSLLTVKKF